MKNELSTPAADETEWTAVASYASAGTRPAYKRRETIKAKSWFEARELACQLLGVGLDEVTVTRK